MKLLVYEPECVGHRRIYAAALLESWCKFDENRGIVCAFHPNLIASVKKNVGSAVQFVQTRECASDPARCFNEALSIARTTGCDEILLLYGDIYTRILAFYDEPHPPKFSLLLFRYEVDLLDRFPATARGLAEITRQLSKRLLLEWLLPRPCVESVLFIDPWVSRHFSTRYPEKVGFVPEPVRGSLDIAQQNSRAAETTLAVIGSVDERKGLEELCSALELLTPSEAIRIQVTGRVVPGYDVTFERIMTRMRQLPNVATEVRASPFDESEIPAIVGRADVICLLYGYRHAGMSSLLAWAIVCGRKVITIRWGLLGFVARTYGAGYCAMSMRARHIATAVRNAIIARKSARIEDRRRALLELMAGFRPEEFLSGYVDRNNRRQMIH